MNAIQIKNITKRYKDVTALDDISFSFEFGRIYGFLGRNGAGKSTLINIIANRIFADQGEVLIDGIPAKENMGVHEKIFCMSEADLYDRDLKVKDHFKWTNRFYNDFDLDKAFELSKKFNLDINKRFKALSKGYQSIFKLIIALSLNVPYVIFDEPVLGLDANHRELFYSLLLKEFENNERTLIIATHLIEEVSNIIEEVVLIDKGKILLQETVEELLEKGYFSRLFSGLYVQKKPPFGKWQQCLHSLFNTGERRDCIYGKLCSAKQCASDKLSCSIDVKNGRIKKFISEWKVYLTFVPPLL